MASYHIHKGKNIKLAGKPSTTVKEAPKAETITVFPGEFKGIKPKLLVKEGDKVKIGQPLFFDKKMPALQFTAPAAGTVESIAYGERRKVTAITIRVAEKEEAVRFTRNKAASLIELPRKKVFERLLKTGYFAYLIERPFSKIANPAHSPKSIFVNGMSTAPYQADPNITLEGRENEFQAGLDVLTRLTEGPVHLCVHEKATLLKKPWNHVENHTFEGPHPSGNTSVHIHNIDPIRPGDVVWTIKAEHVAAIGNLFLRGQLTLNKTIVVAGPGVRDEACCYYRVRQGAPLRSVLEGCLKDGEPRIISGNVLSGDTTSLESGGVPFYESSINVIEESRERFFMGWVMPGLYRYSDSRVFLSKWFKPNRKWPLNSNQNGSLRSLVLTGWYDKVMPMNIMTDYLVRAALAHDTDESVKLGILETDPEDFALCSFICPSKVDLGAIIQQGLDDVEADGI